MVLLWRLGKDIYLAFVQFDEFNNRIQAGQYEEAYAILEDRVKIELEQLGERPDELADIYQSMAKCKSEVCAQGFPNKVSETSLN